MAVSNHTKKYLSACATMLACGTVFLPTFAGAAGEMNKTATKETTININQNVVVFSGRMSLGLLNSQAGEYVYLTNPEHKLSQLDYKVNNVFMLGLGGSVSPLSWLKINGDIWFKLNDGNGTMNDYDWMLDDYQYTDWSHHEDVDLTKGLMLDVNAELVFYKWEGSRFFGSAGFKYDNWEWEVRGGDFIYSSYYLYDTVGSFPDGQLVLTYEQKFYTPYVGIGFSSDLNPTPLTFSGRVIYSPFVFADSTDQHHLRDLVSEDEYDSGEMFGVDLSAAYNFNKHFSLMLAYHYLKYRDLQDNAHRKDLTTGITTTYTDAEDSMDNKTDMVSFSAVVNF